MFCPKCGVDQSDELKFCNKCGANLYAVRQVVGRRDAEEKFDWNKSWVTEMFLTEAERKRRHAERELEQGITPEVKRFQEIKAGVITSCVGIAAMIVLYILMTGIILSGKVDADVAQILARVWIAGIIPLLVGIGLIINGSFVSKKMVETMNRNAPQRTITHPAELSGQTTQMPSLNPQTAHDFVTSVPSVVEDTTELLEQGRKGERKS